MSDVAVGGFRTFDGLSAEALDELIVYSNSVRQLYSIWCEAVMNQPSPSFWTFGYFIPEDEHLKASSNWPISRLRSSRRANLDNGHLSEQRVIEDMDRLSRALHHLPRIRVS